MLFCRDRAQIQLTICLSRIISCHKGKLIKNTNFSNRSLTDEFPVAQEATSNNEHSTDWNLFHIMCPLVIYNSNNPNDHNNWMVWTLMVIVQTFLSLASIDWYWCVLLLQGDRVQISEATRNEISSYPFECEESGIIDVKVRNIIT